MQASQHDTGVPSRCISKPAGGFRPITVAQICSAWWAYQTGLLRGFLDLRVYLALHEIEERRLVAGRVRSRKGRPGLKVVWTRERVIREARTLIGGKSDRLVAAALRRLETQGVVRIEPSGFSFGIRQEALTANGPRDRRVPVPRPLLRYLARAAKPSVTATALAYLIRCVWWRENVCCLGGRCTSALVSDLFGVNARSVKRARLELRRIGWLTHAGAENPQVCVPNLGWSGVRSEVTRSSGKQCDTALSLRQPVSGTELSPPSISIQLRSGSKNQQPPARARTGIRRRMQGNPKPRMSNVQSADLRSTERLQSLFEQASVLGLVAPTPADRLRFFAAAARASRLGSCNPGGFFAALVRRGLWHYVSQVDENRALERLRSSDREAVSDGPCPAQRIGADKPRKSNASGGRLGNVQALVAALVAHCSMDKRSNKGGNANMIVCQPEGLRRGTQSADAHPFGDERSEPVEGNRSLTLRFG